MYKSLLVTNPSDVRRPCFSPLSLEWNLQASTSPPTIPSWSATWTSVRTYTPTQCVVWWLHHVPRNREENAERNHFSPQWEMEIVASSRRVDTLFGSEDRSWPRYRPSNRCGYMMNLILYWSGKASKTVWNTISVLLEFESNICSL